MKAIILAGGKATRLPYSAQDRPKALVEVAGKPILRHQLELLDKHRIYDIRLALGFKADQIIERLKTWPTGRQNVDYVIESEPLGTGGAIKFASQDIDGDFLVVNGDILTDFDLSGFIGHHSETKRKIGRDVISLAAWKCRDCSDFGLIKHYEGRVLEFLEKPAKPVKGYINAGFYLFNKVIFENEPRSVFSVEHDVFPNAAECGNLFVHLFEGFWTDVGTEERLVKAEKVYLDKII